MLFLLKIIIIEDDMDARLGLTDVMDWNDLGLSLCGSAANGRLGLELARKVRPDVIILDVRMPIMNGMECAREIRKFLPQCSFVFLSGYSDKKYLKEAIKLQAVDYLEKPVDLNELSELLERIVRNYKITQIWKGFSKESNQYQKVFSLVNEYMILWIDNQLDKERFISWTARLHIDMDPDGYFYSFYTLCSERKMLNTDTFIKIYDIFADHMGKYSFVAHPYDDGIATIVECDHPIRLDSIYEVANGINTICQQGCKKNCVTAFSEEAKGYHCVAHQFRKLNKRIQLYLIYGYGTVITPAMSKSSKSVLSESDINHVIYLISIEKVQVSLCELRKLEQLAYKAGDNDIKRVQMLFIYLYFSLNNLLSEKGILSEADVFTEMMNNLNQLQSSTIKDIVHLCEEKVSIISQLLKDVEISDVRIKKVISYMQSNYSSDVSLDRMADYVSLSPTYLSGIFKKETGKNVLQYLEDIRITKSLSLLSRGDLSISEIANMVGYRTPHYFAQIFKRVTGISPSMYKKQV